MGSQQDVEAMCAVVSKGQTQYCLGSKPMNSAVAQSENNLTSLHGLKSNWLNVKLLGHHQEEQAPIKCNSLVAA